MQIIHVIYEKFLSDAAYSHKNRSQGSYMYPGAILLELLLSIAEEINKKDQIFCFHGNRQ